MKKFLAYLLVICIALSSSALATELNAEDYAVWLEYPYGNVVSAVKDYLAGGEATAFVPNAISMFLLDYGPDAAAEIGFTIVEFTGDTDPELVFARINSTENGICTGKEIIAAYSLEGLTPYLILEGSARKSYMLLPGARVYSEGSYSAYISGCGVYAYSGEHHDYSLALVDSYTAEYGEQGGVTYVRTTPDAAGERVTEQLSISSEEYRARVATMAKDVITLTLTPVSGFVSAK